MSQFRPVHEAHAIDQLAVSVQFNAALTDEAMAAVGKSAEPFKADLPRVVELGGFPIGGGAGGIAVQGFQIQFPNVLQVNAGRAFSRFRDDGSVAAELRVERLAVTYRTTAYLTWRQLWDDNARSYFDVVLPEYAAHAAIASISLSYLDKFYWDGDVADARAPELLRMGSKYVSPFVYDLDDLWHSHTGAFLSADGATKRLLNINVDCNDENRSGEMKRVVSILTVLTDMFNQPGYSPVSWNVSETKTFFWERLNQLHDQSKRALSQVINDAMCRRIALGIGT
jgi:uncharacterized protein (TIGR04255 family)